MAATASLFLVTGCATVRNIAQIGTYDMMVSAIADETTQAKRTFVVLPGNPGIALEDLQFREFSTFVGRALRARGFSSPTTEPPDVAVFIAYGVGQPRTVFYTNFTFSGGVAAFSATTRGPDGQTLGTTTGTVSSAPDMRAQTMASTVVDRWLTVQAVDVASLMKERRFVPVWQTTITSEGDNADLRAVFPMLIAAGQPFLAETTREAVLRRLFPTAPEVQALRSPDRP